MNPTHVIMALLAGMAAMIAVLTVVIWIAEIGSKRGAKACNRANLTSVSGRATIAAGGRAGSHTEEDTMPDYLLLIMTDIGLAAVSIHVSRDAAIAAGKLLDPVKHGHFWIYPAGSMECMGNR